MPPRSRAGESFVERHGLWSPEQTRRAAALARVIKQRKLETIRFSFADQHGVLRGKTPALTRLQVPPGSHRIEIRNGRFPPHVSEIDARPGEQLVVKHSFIAPAAPKPRGLADRLRFWQ